MNLEISEIFYSLEGETRSSGFPALFIRLAGCNLNCKTCDTQYARSPGKKMSFESIMKIIRKYPSADHVTVTGGEPLLQKNTVPLLKKIIAADITCQIETNGSIILKHIPRGVRKIVDIKTPSSGEADSFLPDNLHQIDEHDEIKFLIADNEDYTFAKSFLGDSLSGFSGTVNLSPVHGKMPEKKLAELILQDKLPVRLNIQLHRIIWKSAEEGIQLI